MGRIEPLGLGGGTLVGENGRCGDRDQYGDDVGDRTRSLICDIMALLPIRELGTLSPQTPYIPSLVNICISNFKYVSIKLRQTILETYLAHGL